MQPEAPPQLAAPPKLSTLGLIAWLTAPGAPSVFCPQARSEVSPVPIPAPEPLAAYPAQHARPQSRRGRRRAAAKLRAKSQLPAKETAHE